MGRCVLSIDPAHVIRVLLKRNATEGGWINGWQQTTIAITVAYKKVSVIKLQLNQRS